WLSLAEFWYDTNFHTAIQTTPFEAVYGQKLPVHVPYMHGESAVETIDRTLQVTIRQAQHNKLSSKYYGPFLKIEKVGAVGYKLDLLDNSQVHPVFHVSQLKLCKGSTQKMGMLPYCGSTRLLSAKPIAILDRKMKKVNNRVAFYVLVKWSNHTDEDATWELYSDLLQIFSDFKENS
ncbi:retrotransposable element Tf2, partial [Tanacetum coccineum]